MSKYTSIITTVTGQSLLAQSVSTQKPLIFTSIRLGDGVLEPSDITANFTALKAEKMIAPINTFDDSLISTGKVTLISTIDNSGVEAGFYAREVGVYAKVGESGTEQLFAYCNAGNYGDYMPDKNSELNETRLAVQLAVGSAANVTAIINSQQYATLENVTDAIAGHDEGTNPHAGVLLKIDDLKDKMLERLAGDDEISLTGLAKSSIFYRLMEFAFNANSNAGFHNSIYRGKNLGSELTDEQSENIRNGTFKDLYIGDYWTINGVNWRIAAFDYWLHCGDTECTTHHAIIVPDTNLATAQMNKTNVTTGAYIGSDMYTGHNGNTGLATAKTAINNAFGSAHILNHRQFFANAVTDGRPSAASWYDSTVDLMNEQMVYGGKIFESTANGTNGVWVHTIDKGQLPLFALEPSRICNRATWWLRSVASGATFCYVHSHGDASHSNASYSHGVRPAFAIY